MNKYKKIIWIVVIAILLAGNIYAFGWKIVERNLMNKGANMVLNSILNSIKKGHDFRIGTKDGDVYLMQKPDMPAEPQIQLPNK